MTEITEAVAQDVYMAVKDAGADVTPILAIVIFCVFVLWRYGVLKVNIRSPDGVDVQSQIERRVKEAEIRLIDHHGRISALEAVQRDRKK